MKYVAKPENMETSSRAHGRDLSISTKHSVEVCNNIRGKSVEKAKRFLEGVVKKTSAVKMTRYIMDRAHQKGIGAGRFPVKAAAGILTIIKSAEANAQNKGLSTKDLIISHISAHKAARPWHFGRQRRRKMKRTHIQVIVSEFEKEQKKEDKK